jgi:hypothetical protein
MENCSSQRVDTCLAEKAPKIVNAIHAPTTIFRWCRTAPAKRSSTVFRQYQAAFHAAAAIAYTHTVVWETIFLLVVLKIPIVYLGVVVWWAVRSEPAPPEPLEPAVVPVPHEPDPRSGWRFLRRGVRPLPRRGPHGSPQRARARRRAPLPQSWLAADWRPEK